MIKLELTEDEMGIIVRSLEQSQSYIWAVQGSGGREQVEKRLRVLEKLSSRKDEVHTSIGETIDIQRELDWLDDERKVIDHEV